MVIINTNPPPTPAPITSQITRETVDHGILQTPQRSSQVRDLIRNTTANGLIDPTIRLLFRKVGRGLDQQNVKIAAAEAQIDNLEVQVDHLRPRKRQKVNEDPNQRFTRIEHVMETRAKLKPTTAAAIMENYKFEDLCFEWQL